jgi:predicted small integral membrane protein
MRDKRDEKISYIEITSIALIIIGVCGVILKMCVIASFGIVGLTGIIIVRILRNDNFWKNNG